MPPEKLIRMANQIAGFMASRPPAEGAPGVAAHISDYWAPPMRAQLLDVIAAGGAGLHPLVIAAAPLIRRPDAS
ncbi:MAG: formate dehydrogenase subunit delta [Gemmobacter sp.]